MSYIGNPIVSTDFPVDYFSGNGSTTAFTLSVAPASVNAIDVQVSGVSQSPQTYSVSGTTLTFTAAPPTGSSNIVVRHRGVAGIPNTPSAASVTPAALSTPNAVYWDGSGNVGVGTTSPATKLHVVGTSLIPATIQSNQSLTFLTYKDSATTDAPGVGSSGNNMVFYTASTERIRIDSSGYVMFGATTPLTGHKLSASTDAAHKWGFGPYLGIPSQFFVSYNGNTGVYLNGGGTSWTANSDERLKTELKPFENAVEKISSLRAGTGRYLTDNESVSRSFLIAQDVQKVLPEAVNVQADEIGTLGLQYQDLIPLLVASVKELNAKVEAQALEIQALKGTA